MSVIFCKERKQPIFSSFFQLTLRKITVDHFLTPLRRGIRFTKDSLYPHRRQLVRSFSVSKVCKFLRNCLTEFQFTNCIRMIFTKQCIKSKSCFSIQHDFFRLKRSIAALKLKVSVFQITQKCFRLMIGFIGQAKELHTIGRITDSTSTDHSLLEIRESSRLCLILTGADAITVFCFKNRMAQILRNIKLIGQHSAFISKAHILAINNVNLLSMTRKPDIPEPEFIKRRKRDYIVYPFKGALQTHLVSRTGNPGAGMNTQHRMNHQLAILLNPQPEVIGRTFFQTSDKVIEQKTASSKLVNVACREKHILRISFLKSDTSG